MPIDLLFVYWLLIIKKKLLFLKLLVHIFHQKVLFKNVYLADSLLARVNIQIFVLDSFMKVLLMG